MEVGSSGIPKPKTPDASNNLAERLGEPRMFFEIFYTGHGNGDQLDKLKEPFKKCDIYIPESVGWSNSDLKNYGDVASGVVSMAQIQASFRVDQNFLYQECVIIHNSHKPIAIADIPAGHPLIEKFNKLMGGWFNGEYKRETFQEALDAVTNHFVESANIQKEREGYMLSQLRPKILEEASTNPQLRSKKEIRVLMLLGRGHEWIFNEMVNGGYSVNKVSNSTSQDSFRIEAIKIISSGKEISQDFASKIFLENELELSLSSYMKGITGNSSDTQLFYRIIASRFTFDETREIFEAMRKMKISKGIIAKKLKEKEIKLPESPAQLRAFISKQ